MISSKIDGISRLQLDRKIYFLSSHTGLMIPWQLAARKQYSLQPTYSSYSRVHTSAPFRAWCSCLPHISSIASPLACIWIPDKLNFSTGNSWKGVSLLVSSSSWNHLNHRQRRDSNRQPLLVCLSLTPLSTRPPWLCPHTQPTNWLFQRPYSRSREEEELWKFIEKFWMHAYVFATWKVLFNRVITLLELKDDFGCLDCAVTVLLRIWSRHWGVSSVPLQVGFH